MIAAMSLQDIARDLGAQLHGKDCDFFRVSTDTRSLQPGDLFVALRGERFDAHDFLSEAVKGQASALVVEHVDPTIALPQLEVQDTTLALGQIARLNRRRFGGRLVAITGSGGKTTVKALLANILGHCGNTYATRGNLNNHIGVPLSLLELGPEHQYAVIEMGASGPGEIAYLVEIAEPAVGLVNNALRAHVEGFGSLEGIAWAKGEMFAGLPTDGTAVVNLDDPQVDVWLGQVGERARLTFSVQGKATDIAAREIKELAGGGFGFVLHTPAGDAAVELQLVGRHNVANALAAAACAYAAGAGLEAIKAGLEGSEAVAGRMQLHQTSRGVTVIDDSYNANPDSVRAAIDALAERKGRRVLVLGDMAELGSEADELHRDIGVYARTAGIETLLTVGTLTRLSSEAFGRDGHHFDDCQQAIDFLRDVLEPNATVLVKGSRSARMERVVAALTADGEQ